MYVKVILIMAILEISYMECSERGKCLDQGSSCVYNLTSKLLDKLIKSRGRYRKTHASDLPINDDSPEAKDHLDVNQQDDANIEPVEQFDNDSVVKVVIDTGTNVEQVKTEKEAPTLSTKIESSNPKSEVENMEKNIQNCFDRLSTVEKNMQNCFDGLSNVEKNVQNCFDVLSNVEINVQNCFDGLANVEKNVQNYFDGLSNVEKNVQNCFDRLSNVEKNEFNIFPNRFEMYPPMYHSYYLSGTNTINNQHSPLQPTCFPQTGPDCWRIAPVRMRKRMSSL